MDNGAVYMKRQEIIIPEVYKYTPAANLMKLHSLNRICKAYENNGMREGQEEHC